MASETDKSPKVPPKWFEHVAWRVHRGLFKLSGGRFLWTPASKRGWGALRLTTTGRRSGKPRSVIIGYLEDGPNLVVLAMNGWQSGHPAWWLNLREHPDAIVELSGAKPRRVHARETSGAERDRLWDLWREPDPELDGYAAQRPTETPVIVLERVDPTEPSTT